MKKLILLDSSYLCEFFEVPGFHEASLARRAKAHFKDEVKDDTSFFVDMMSLFWLADHIRDCRDGNLRRSLGVKLKDAVANSLKNNIPWTILQVESAPEGWLPDLLELYIETGLPIGLGLSNMFAAEKAKELKAKYSASPVHIWTKIRELKSQEPDAERNSWLA